MAILNKAFGARLRALRGNHTLQEVADRAGVSLAAVQRYEKGRVPRGDILSRLASVFRVTANFLLNGDEVINEAVEAYGVPPGIPEDIPVVGRGRGGQGEFNVDGYPVGEGMRRVRRPYDVRDPNAFAVLISGDSMSPRYEAGDIVVCSPAHGWVDGDYCVVVTVDDEAMVKRVYRRDGGLLLLSIAPGYDPVLLANGSVRAVHKIVWRKER